MTIWKRAGVRATPEEAKDRLARRRAKQNRNEYLRQRGVEEARQRWESGQVRPVYITRALDLRGLYGPEVDIACGGVEPMVDRWESGDLYPTWEQLLKLADLTRMPVSFFTRPMGPAEVAPFFLCGRHNRSREIENEPVYEFTHTARAAAGLTAWQFDLETPKGTDR